MGYEKTCVLFNIGALASQIASEQNLDSDEGLKAAAKNYQVSKTIQIELVCTHIPVPPPCSCVHSSISDGHIEQGQKVSVEKALRTLSLSSHLYLRSWPAVRLHT